MPNRECGTCTKCCEGYLLANINGVEVRPGKPCLFVEIGKGCKVYRSRPTDPCRTFECTWLISPDMPEHFKPETSGVLIVQTTINDIKYYRIIKAPNEPTVEIVSWMVVASKINNFNLAWEVENSTYWIGSEEFCKNMLETHPVTSPNK